MLTLMRLKLYTSSGRTRAENDNYSPDIRTAYATYARAALNRQDYSVAAANAAKARVDHPLMDLSEYKKGFSTPNSEWIWSCYGASDETLYFYSYQAYIAYNSSAGAVRSTPKCISKILYEQLPETDIRRNFFL
ncbi:hypothetical protein EZS27_035266, partial [termite gut metagenome]